MIFPELMQYDFVDVSYPCQIKVGDFVYVNDLPYEQGFWTKVTFKRPNNEFFVKVHSNILVLNFYQIHKTVRRKESA